MDPYLIEKYLSYSQCTRNLEKEDSERLSKLSVPIPPDEAQRLFLLRESTLFESSHTEPSFDRFCTLAKRMFKVPFVLINLIDVDRAFVKSTAGVPTMQEFPRDTSFCSYTIFPDFPEVFVVEDSHLDERFKNYFCVVNPPHVRFYAGAALILNNVRVGSLCIHGLEPRAFTTEEVSDSRFPWGHSSHPSISNTYKTSLASPLTEFQPTTTTTTHTHTNP